MSGSYHFGEFFALIWDKLYAVAGEVLNFITSPAVCGAAALCVPFLILSAICFEWACMLEEKGSDKVIKVLAFFTYVFSVLGCVVSLFYLGWRIEYGS